MLKYPSRWSPGGEISRRDFLKGVATAVSVATTVSVVGLLDACAPKTTALPQGKNEVWIVGRSFVPEKLIVPKGATVTWTNKDTEVHTVTSDTGLFSGSLPPGGSFRYTFTEHKGFHYYCVNNPGMKGDVFVEQETSLLCDDCHA